MREFQVGDLVRWGVIARGERPHLGIVLKDPVEWMHHNGRYRVQWFTDNNKIGWHSAEALVKAEVQSE